MCVSAVMVSVDSLLNAESHRKLVPESSRGSCVHELQVAAVFGCFLVVGELVPLLHLCSANKTLLYPPPPQHFQ